MAELQTKWINVGTDSGFVTQYGFGQSSASSNNAQFGSIANSEDGSLNVNLDSVYSGADVRSFVYVALSGFQNTTLTLTGNRANSGWDTVSIGNSTLNRSDATHSYNSNGNFTSWNWSGATNYFGTTNNEDYEIVFDDGVAATPTAPTDITFGPDPGTYSATVSITATASGGTNGTMKVSADGTTWVANGSSFTFTRNTAKTIYARTEGSGSNSSNYSESHTVGYKSPDLNVSVSRSPSGNLAHDYTGNVTVTISNGTANNRYRVLRTTGGNTGRGNTGILTGTSGTVGLHNADNGDLPNAGQTLNYIIQGRVDTAKGGNNSYASTNASFSITRLSDNAPDAFTFTDQTNVTRGSTQTSNQITVAGLGSGVSTNVSVTGGQYSKNGGSYTSAATTAVNGDTFRVRHTASSSFGTTVSTTLNIGGVTDTFSSTTIAEDTTPASFSFTDVTNVARSTTKTSNQITITGINSTANVSITGGTYSKNGGSYTSSAGTASNNDTFTVRHTSSSSFNTATNTTLTVGGVSDTYTSTTIAEDTTPNAFTFTDVTGVSQSTTQTSNTITVSGINSSASVSVSGGTYSKNGGAYTSSAGTASNGDTFAVRHTSASDFNTAVNTVLTIGGVSDTYTSTTAAFSGNTYYVDAFATGTFEAPSDVFANLSVSGTGWTTNSAGRQIAAGDRVGFRNTANSGMNGQAVGINASVAGFHSNYWTNTSNLTLSPGGSSGAYTFKYAKTGIPVSTADAVTVSASYTQNGNTASDSSTGYFVGSSKTPDTTITLNTDTVTRPTAATDHQITISEATPNTNSSITEYKVVDANSSHESRTGPGTITVTDVPGSTGFPKTYSIQARITTANGGSGNWISTGDTYQVIRTAAAPDSNDPTETGYGISVYDHQGTLVTSFQEGHTTLRKLFSQDVTLSTTGTTTVSTGLSGITASNCVILIEQADASGTNVSPNTPARFTGSGTISVEIARTTVAGAVKVTVAQYKGSTIGSSSTYGFQVSNEDGDGVIDQSSTVYAVREIIDINTSLSTQTLQTNETTNFVYVTLTEGRYPSSAGTPIPALNSSTGAYIIPPVLSRTTYTDGSFKTVILYLPKGAALNTYKLAMLVDSDATDPIYFGGSEPDYGVELFDSSGNIVWHSGWRQAIVNNIISANQFTTGTNQNGNYDVVTGYDGVTGGAASASEFDQGLESTGQIVTVSSLDNMDPQNAYVLGLGVQGFVHYRTGRYLDTENGIDERRGGGRHLPAIRVNSETSVSMTMWRFSGGFNTGGYASRDPVSKHPDGNFIIARIV